MEMDTKHAFHWPSVILVMLFCLLAALGGGLTVRNVLTSHAAWILPFYGLVGGIFVAFGAVILTTVIKSLREE